MSAPLLEVEDLRVSVKGPGGMVEAVTGVSFQVGAGDAMGLVGESGSGKSLTLRAILGLLPPGARITGGSVRFDGIELIDAPRALHRVRGGGISMIFQEPMTALNPVLRVGRQIVDGARRRQGWSRAKAREETLRLAREMGIADAEEVLDLYPHELSGGLRQRVMIAAALANGPRLLLCDEPTTALDVTIQDQIIKLLDQLRADLSMSLLYVTHDLAVVGQLCQRVEVMYAGTLLERGPVGPIFRAPSHPYTLGLIKATPDVDSQATLTAIPGSAPSVFDRPSGCVFHPRCPVVSEDCKTGEFPLRERGDERATACIHPERCEAPSEARQAG
jgi:peptide/nickel transport system ATP-binding protein